MMHFKGLPEKQLGESWLTIGSFDGVHLGHQDLIQRLVSGAHSIGMLAGVMTFDPHPAEVLRGLPDSFYLTTPEEKAHLLQEAGVDFVATVPFTQDLASLSPEQFIEYTIQSIQVRTLMVGRGFALGKGRAGTVDVLNEIGLTRDFKVVELEPFSWQKEIISSSLIRTLLGEGKIDLANKMLGRLYSVSGSIHHGDGRGHTIGFPTANIKLPPRRLLPASGVYVCTVNLDGRIIPAVSNIGIRPTFDTGDIRPGLEVHLLDYAGDLYDRTLQVNFVERLRDEKKFSSIEDLIHQIEFDISKAREMLQ
jgi:riboflavin kinase/FMN adenylyltransferase